MEEIDVEKVYEKFEEMTKNAENVQKEFLKKLLEENGCCEYLQKLGLNGKSDPQSYKLCVPLSTHKDYKPYIDRILDGDVTSFLTKIPITTFSLSSGTTQGQRKFIPFTHEMIKSTMEIYQTSFVFRQRKYPINVDGKGLNFIYGSKPIKKENGLIIGTISAHACSDSFFESGKALQCESCIPEEVIWDTDFYQSLYCHLLCGLIFKDEIQFVFAIFAHIIVQAFRTFQDIWELLCLDIQNGVLNTSITNPVMREAISKLLKPNPELANLIRTQCSELDNWYGVIPKIFPNAKYVRGVMTGSMESYVNKVGHYAGNLPVISLDYGSSEGWIGVNIDPELPPELVSFTLLPNIAYFEFLPCDPHSKCSHPLGLTEVKVGEEYEVIITNPAGLYRYKLGDVVKVIGFHNSTPKVFFVCRSDIILNINLDKTTDKALQLSIEEARKILIANKLDIIDYTSFGDKLNQPGHYVIFWEVNGEVSDDILEECCNCLDTSFVDMGYIGQRKAKCIGPLELRILRNGTFQKFIDDYIERGGTINQFKLPRCLKMDNIFMKILSQNVVKSYFSTAY